MKLFTVGPVLMYPETLDVASKQLPYFRTDEFSKIMLETAERLKRIIGTSQNSEAIFITGSGTASMEAVVSNAFDSSDRVLIIDGGSFGHRFKQLCDIYQIPNDTISLSFGETLTQEHFDSIDGTRYTALLVNIHETSTGQLYDIHLLQNFCKQYHLFLVVDAISSFLSDPYQMDDFGIDCTIISSQKALSLSPGLSMVIMNSSFYQKKIQGKAPKNLYLNIEEHVRNMKRGQTPNTPAVGIILELQNMLQKVEQIGVNTIIRNTEEKANYFRNQINSLGITLPSYSFSNTLTPILFENGKAKEVYQHLRKNYDITVTPSGGALGNKLLRVGHIGNVSFADYDELIQRMKEVL